VQVLGPQWPNDKYHVGARGGDDFRTQFQAALASRLRLRLQRANQALPVKVLTVADRARFQSQLSQGGETRLEGTNSSLSATNVPAANLEKLLAGALRSPVINRDGTRRPALIRAALEGW
jgi:hypothetical protein